MNSSYIDLRILEWTLRREINWKRFNFFGMDLFKRFVDEIRIRFEKGKWHTPLFRQWNLNCFDKNQESMLGNVYRSGVYNYVSHVPKTKQFQETFVEKKSWRSLILIYLSIIISRVIPPTAQFGDYHSYNWSRESTMCDTSSKR